MFLQLLLTYCVNKTRSNVDILFGSNKLKRICTEEKEGIKVLGAECAKKLRTRLSDLAAAYSLEVMKGLPGRPHELKGDRVGQISLDLKHPYRLLLVPTEEPPPRKADGGLDWTQITSVTIVAIEDTHG